MRKFLQDLGSQNETDLANSVDEIDWVFNERSQSRLPDINRNLPSVRELTRHLSNWAIVFIPPVRALDLRGDMELISCLESTDHHISPLATIMLGYEELNYVGSIEKFSEILNSKCQTILRLEIGRLIYTRYRDPQALRKEVVPNLIANENQYNIIFENNIQRKRFLSHIQELVIWDIATQGEGPRRNGRSGGYDIPTGNYS